MMELRRDFDLYFNGSIGGGYDEREKKENMCECVSVFGRLC
jgi:hypothetical protein